MLLFLASSLATVVRQAEKGRQAGDQYLGFGKKSEYFVFIAEFEVRCTKNIL